MPKIDITPLKKIAKELGSETVKSLIEAQRSLMDIEDFLANVKAWEIALQKEKH